ncbi:hypothetical protein DYB32_009710 [Aphanomyces invadans]|nr:hypothetical protein DYB32_009710 [Aphanomyces invadans]
MHVEAVVYVLLGAGLMSVYVYFVTRVDKVMRRKRFTDRMKSYAQVLRDDRRLRMERVHRMQAILEDEHGEDDSDDDRIDVDADVVRLVLS